MDIAEAPLTCVSFDEFFVFCQSKTEPRINLVSIIFNSQELELKLKQAKEQVFAELDS